MISFAGALCGRDICRRRAVDEARVYIGPGPGWYGPGWYGAGWYWDPWFGVWTFLPADGIFYSPFGWGFYSPIFVYRSPFYFGCWGPDLTALGISTRRTDMVSSREVDSTVAASAAVVAARAPALRTAALHMAAVAAELITNRFSAHMPLPARPIFIEWARRDYLSPIHHRSASNPPVRRSSFSILPTSASQ